MSKTREEVTIHGNVKYETGKCDYCQHEVVKDDLKYFYNGELVDEYILAGNRNLVFSRRPTRYQFCSGCFENPSLVAKAASRIQTDRHKTVVHFTQIVTLAIMIVGIVAYLAGVM